MSTSTNVNIKSPNFSCMSSTALEMHPYQYHIDACYTPTTTPTISPPSSTPRATAKPPNLRLSPHGPYIYIFSYAYEYINQQHNSLPISHTLCNATATAQYKPKQLGYTILGWVLSCDATKFISHKVLTFWHSSHVCVCARVGVCSCLVAFLVSNQGTLETAAAISASPTYCMPHRALQYPNSGMFAIVKPLHNMPRLLE